MPDMTQPNGAANEMPTGVYQRIRRPVEERFLAKVDKNGPDGCWIWNGSLGDGGYGQFAITHAKPLGAHRVSMMLFCGAPILSGREIQIDHLCRNKRCVNPDHLEFVTASVNVRRALAYRKVPHFQNLTLSTHCRSGHEYTEANTHWYRGYRMCRACHAASERRRRRLGIASKHRARAAKGRR